MPYKKSGARRKRADLTESQFWELTIGPNGIEGTDLGDGLGCLSAFKSEAERKRAWLANRDAILVSWPGRINPLFGERTYDRSAS